MSVGRAIVFVLFAVTLRLEWTVKGERISSSGGHSHKSRSFPTFSNPLFFTTKTRLIEETPQSSGEKSSGLDRGIANLKKAQGLLQSLFKSHSTCTKIGNYPIPHECTKFYECKQVGDAQTTTYCPVGKLFDHLKRECLVAADAHCRGLCKFEGELQVDPLDPNNFYKCINGAPKSQECPPNTEFKASSLSCRPKGEADQAYEYEDE